MLPPASGTGQFNALAAKTIRFVRKGCTNRPFYHIVAAEVSGSTLSVISFKYFSTSQTKSDQMDPVIEQLGTYDPIPNEHNEKLVSLNLERIRHWIGNGADVSTPVAELFG